MCGGLCERFLRRLSKTCQTPVLRSEASAVSVAFATHLDSFLCELLAASLLSCLWQEVAGIHLLLISLQALATELEL